MVEILLENKLVPYKNNLAISGDKIDFNAEGIDLPESARYIVPGFIDMHIHGVKNADVMDGAEGVKVMSSELVKEGTTSFLATTMTSDFNQVKEVISSLKDLEVSGAEVLGVHLEGPFISKNYIGAQNPDYVLEPNVQLFKDLNEDGIIKVVTYAPEEDYEFEFTKYLAREGIIPSVGHSAASLDIVNRALKYGLKSFTHFHNAASPHHHRLPGVVTGGFMNPEVNLELIVDGIHVHPEVVKFITDIHPRSNICLITDSMRAKSMPDGEYELGGLEVIKQNDQVRLKENATLAGSILKMNDAVRNICDFSNVTKEEAFLMASFNPAKLLNLVNKGQIKSGYAFDIVILDENFEVLRTYKNGKIVFERES